MNKLQERLIGALVFVLFLGVCAAIVIRAEKNVQADLATKNDFRFICDIPSKRGVFVLNIDGDEYVIVQNNGNIAICAKTQPVGLKPGGFREKPKPNQHNGNFDRIEIREEP